MKTEAGKITEESEISLLLLKELQRLRRESAGYEYLFTVPEEEVAEFESDITEGRVESLRLKFQEHSVLLTERVRITEEQTGWKLDDLRVIYLVVKETPTELVVYGKEKPISEEDRLKYESGIQTITTATSQPDTIGTWPPDENYPNKELVRQQTRSELYPMGRNAPYLWVKNEGSGDIYVLTTTNGIEWSYAESKLSQNEVRVFENVYALALRTDVDGTQYHASEYKVITGQINISKVISGDTTIDIAPAYWSGRTKAYEDTNFTAAESPRELDVNTALGRNAHDGYLINDGAGNIQIAFSDDGTNYGDNHTIEINEVMDFHMLDIDTIRLTWVANCGYRILII